MSTKWDSSDKQKGRILVLGKTKTLVDEEISLPLDSKWTSFTKTFTVDSAEAGKCVVCFSGMNNSSVRLYNPRLVKSVSEETVNVNLDPTLGYNKYKATIHY
jgi:hypothetical protein